VGGQGCLYRLVVIFAKAKRHSMNKVCSRHLLPVLLLSLFIGFGGIAEAQHNGTPSSGQQPIRFSGMVRAGETFRHPLGHDLVFVIAPEPDPDFGWEMRVVHVGQNDDYSGCVTGPYHGITALDIRGDGVPPGPDSQYFHRGNEVYSTRHFRFVLNVADWRKTCAAVEAAQYGPMRQGKDGTWIIGQPGYREPPVGHATVLLNHVHLDSANSRRIADFHFNASIQFPIPARPGSS